MSSRARRFAYLVGISVCALVGLLVGFMGTLVVTLHRLPPGAPFYTAFAGGTLLAGLFAYPLHRRMQADRAATPLAPERPNPFAAIALPSEPLGYGPVATAVDPVTEVAAESPPQALDDEAAPEITPEITPQPTAEERFFVYIERLARAPVPKPSSNTLIWTSVIAVGLLLRDGVAWALVLGSILLFHEAGHALAMKAFGYRDVRMFFIPFFGAAVTGTSKPGPAWRACVVLLAGPVPGVLVGLALGLGPRFGFTLAEPWKTHAFMLVLINTFNLLPIYPLDGGRLLQTLLFSRGGRGLSLGVESLFTFAGALALLALGLRLHEPAMALFGVFIVFGLAGRRAIADAGARLAQVHGPIDEVATLPTPVMRDLWTLARASLPEGQRFLEAPVLNRMRAIGERASRRPLGGVATVLVTLTYLASLFAALVAMVLLAARRTRGH
jgi:Zn-dependent protease